LKRLIVRWARPASLDLFEIIEFIRQDRPTAARKMGGAILREVSRLGKNPRRGKVVPELSDQGISDYRQLIIAPYRVIYGIKADSVSVEAVIDSRRDLQNALFQRLIR
jgi:toxin ParE1/3/4